MNLFAANKGHKITVVLCLLAIVLFFAIFSKSLSLDSSKISSPLVGKPAKTFQVRLLQGSEFLVGNNAEKVDLEDLKGSPLIINFWSSWCSSCAEESRVLEVFWREHSSEGLKVLGIAVHDRAEDLMPFVKTMGKTYAIALDEEGRVALNYGVTGVPETVFINSQGIVVHKEVGPVTGPLLEKILAQLKSGST